MIPKKRFLPLTALLAIAAVAALAVPVALAEVSRRAATDYTFDGFRLGASFRSAVMSKAPYQHPCDADPIEDRGRTIVVYMGQECRGQTFPDRTTVLFYLRYAADDASLDQPVEAIAWMGGSYFDTRSDFPARIGQPPAQVDRALGPAASTFRLGGRRRFVTVRAHPGNVYSVVYERRVVAFVVGQMPADHEAESWEGLLEMIGESMER